MVVHPLAAVETGGAGGLDDGLEIPVIGVAEHFGEVAAGPEFVACRVGAADGFKWGDFLAHGFGFLRLSSAPTVRPIPAQGIALGSGFHSH